MRTVSHHLARLLFFSTLFLGCATAKIDSKNASHQFKLYLDKKFDERAERSPQSKTYLGIKTDYDKLDIWTEEYLKEEYELDQQDLSDLKKNWSTFELDPTSRLSFELFERDLNKSIEAYAFRHHNYPVNPSFGFHNEIPSFLINFHLIDTIEDAEAYIARIKDTERYIDEALVQLKLRQEKGIILPKFLFPKVLDNIQHQIEGTPLQKEAKQPHALAEDFKKKIERIKLEPEQTKDLTEKLNQALLNHYKPAYEKLRVYLKDLEKLADDRAGVWKFPNGEEFYNFKLRQYTTTDMTAESIHQLGLEETQRIHEEMKGIMKTVGFKGDLKAFFKKMQTDRRFYYVNNQRGRDKYLQDTNMIIDTMRERLPELFSIFPKASLEVKAVEKFREKSAPMAFYTGPSLEGSRPGIYYVNLYDLTHVPKYEMEALAYHEAIPGHHMQVSLQQEMTDLPKFRRLGGYTAYTEGWGLYAESLPKLLGMYQDPYSDFGRFSMELMRAGRLVVDTGLHYKKWTREQAIQWLDENTPDNHSDNTLAIDRYIVMPGQATAYRIGMIKFLDLRSKAEKALGDKFDIRRYHDTVLNQGAVPLETLERLVDEWILNEKKVHQ